MNIPLFLSAAMLGGVSSLSAAPVTWDGDEGGLQDQWTLTDNWILGATPTSVDDAHFPPTAAFIGEIIQVNAQVNSMSINASGYGFADDPANSNPLRTWAGIFVNFTNTGAVTFNAPVRLNATQTFAMNGARGTIFWNETVDLNGKTLTVTGTGIQQFNGGVVTAGNIVKTGTGRVEVNSAMTGGGGVNVQDGVMVFSHATMTRTVSVSATGVVAGSGTVASLSGSSGTVRPGLNGTGVLTVTGPVLLSGTAALEVELINNTPGSGHDQLSSAGSTVSVNGSTLTVLPRAGFSSVPGTTFTILNNTGVAPVTGTFSGKPEGSSFTAGVFTFRISYTGGTGNDVTLKLLSVGSTGVEREWTGAVDSQWGTPGNWIGGVVPQPGDGVLFPEVDAAKRSPQQNLSFGFPIHRVRFTAGGYTLSGNGLTLGDGIVQEAPAGAAENKILLPLASVADATLPALITRVRLQTGGPLTVTPAALSTLALNQTASELRLQNEQPGSPLTCALSANGAGFVSSGGPGPVVLSAAGTQSGGLTVAGPSCVVAVPGAQGAGPVTVTGGLTLGQAGGPAFTVGNALHLSGTVRTAVGSGPVAWTGPVELQYGVDSHLITNGGALTFSGVISGEGDLFLSGSSSVTFSGPAANTWNGNVDIGGISVTCSKSPGVIAIPGNVSVHGVTGALHVPVASQLSATATLFVSGRASAIFSAVQTLASLNLDSGFVDAGPSLTVSGNIIAAATLSTSEINGTLFTSGLPVTWNISGPASPGLRFSGSLGHDGGTETNITKTGAGLLQVNNTAGSVHASLVMSLVAGTLEWNDTADIPDDDFGPLLTMNGGTLTGTGRISEVTAIGGGIISPGVSVGTLAVTDLLIRENVTFLAEWTAAGHDQLTVWSEVQLNNAPLILSGTKPPYGTPWMLIDNKQPNPVGGTFGGMPEGGTRIMDGALLRISYTGGDGNDVVLTRITPPAPALSSFDIAGAVPDDGGAPAGSVVAAGTGLPLFTYALEYSSDLTSWTTATLTTAGLTGAFHFDWPPDDAPPRRFFRISAR